VTSSRADGPRWHPRGLNNGAILAATYYGVTHLPPCLSYGIGRGGTWLAYHLMRQGTRALLQNFAVMFPEHDLPKLHALALRTYRSYARDVIDFMRSLRMTQEETSRLVCRFETDVLERAMSEGRGAIVVSAHFGNWELGALLLRRLTTYSLSVVVRAETNPAVGRLRHDLRAALGVETIEIRQQVETALRIRKRLEDNAVVAMLLDRHLDRDHVEVSFFGKPTKFLRTPALLAALSGAPLVPCFVYRDDCGIAIECGPLIHVATAGDPDSNVRDAVQGVATVIERHCRRHPYYWYQFYPFWPSAQTSDVTEPTRR
jgi:KDO2-lipid IV(A) lauroyltransferase